jgi:hypothetical protein
MRLPPAREALAELRADLRAAFTDGARAIVVETGDPSVVGEDGFAERLLMLGRWLGTPSIQSPQGELVARVERRPGDAQARGTHSDLELAPHTDLHDILALGTVREAAGRDSSRPRGGPARRGPAADAASLPALREGYFFGTNPVLRSRAAVSASEVRFSRAMAMGCNAASTPISCKPPRARGEALPPDLAAAVTDLRALALNWRDRPPALAR